MPAELFSTPDDLAELRWHVRVGIYLGETLNVLSGRAGGVVGCPWSPTAKGVRQGCPVGRHGGSQHGKTTTDGNHSNARQVAQEARW